jgi:diguanylate cyclase (GGDEF)-like protein
MDHSEITWEELLNVQIKKAGSSRIYFVLLQGMFLMIYGFQPFSLIPVEPWLVIKSVSLVAALLVVFTVPAATLSSPSFIGILTLSNAAILLSTMPHTAATGPGMICAVILLLAMASYVPSIVHFGLLTSLITIAYGGILHRADLLHNEAVLLLPALLCLSLVYLSKMGIFQAEFRRLAEDTSHQASTKDSTKDPLTGLPNRAQFLGQLGRIIQYRYVNRHFDFAVLFIDLDGFKPINDKLGHKAGDAVLRHTAKLFQGCVRKGDLVGRYGGDEFTILLNNVKSPAEAAQVAQTILAKIRTPINVGESVVVGASIGIALSTNIHEGAEDLIRDADGAMYRAKAQGKNCYVISDQSDLPKGELTERWKRVTQLNWLLREH